MSDVIHQVAHLHAQGLGCNAIARELGCSPPTVGKAARQLGLNFDRRQTAAATAAVAARLGERRVVLTARLIGTAESALDNLADATDPAVARNWATVAGIAIDKVGVLHRIDNGDRVQVERNDRILTELDNEIADLANKLLEEASQRGAQVNAPILRTFIRQAESNSGGGAGVE